MTQLWPTASIGPPSCCLTTVMTGAVSGAAAVAVGSPREANKQTNKPTFLRLPPSNSAGPGSRTARTVPSDHGRRHRQPPGLSASHKPHARCCVRSSSARWLVQPRRAATLPRVRTRGLRGWQPFSSSTRPAECTRTQQCHPPHAAGTMLPSTPENAQPSCHRLLQAT